MRNERMKWFLCAGLAALALVCTAGCGAAERAHVTAAEDRKPASTAALPSASAFMPTPVTTPAETPTPVPTEVPTPTPSPTPAGELAVVRVDGAGAVCTLLARGFQAAVLGEDGAYYMLRTEDADVLVEKRFVRLSSEAPYAAWTGYAKSKTQVYATAYAEGEPIAVLRLNTKVSVLDAVGNLLLIAWEDQQGYALQKSVGKYRTSTDDGGSGGGSGGGGGGGSGGGADGGDIQLSAGWPQLGTADRLFAFRAPAFAPESGAASPAFPCEGVVLADRVEACLAVFKRGDAVTVVGSDEAGYQVRTDGGIGVVPRPLLQLISEAGYAQWDGYADNQTPFCTDYRLQNEQEKLKRNTKIHVLEDLGTCYVIETDGKIGCIPVTKAKKTRYAVPSDGGSGGGSGGGGGGGGQEWTDPVL